MLAAGVSVTALDRNSRELVGEGLACRRGERLVFVGVSFRLPPGGALLLSGANGSGKTSLLRLLATLITPAEGRLVWADAPVRADVNEYRAALHYVGHQDGVKPHLTPRETLTFWAALHSREARPRSGQPIDEALAFFGLEAVADGPCRWLSAGQRKRLALARLVAASAPIWLLDEPTSGLDRESQLRLEHALREHRASGGLVVMASHTPVSMPEADILNLESFSPSANDAGFAWK